MAPHEARKLLQRADLFGGHHAAVRGVGGRPTTVAGCRRPLPFLRGRLLGSFRLGDKRADLGPSRGRLSRRGRPSGRFDRRLSQWLVRRPGTRLGSFCFTASTPAADDLLLRFAGGVLAVAGFPAAGLFAARGLAAGTRWTHDFANVLWDDSPSSSESLALGSRWQTCGVSSNDSRDLGHHDSDVARPLGPQAVMGQVTVGGVWRVGKWYCRQLEPGGGELDRLRETSTAALVTRRGLKAQQQNKHGNGSWTTCGSSVNGALQRCPFLTTRDAMPCCGGNTHRRPKPRFCPVTRPMNFRKVSAVNAFFRWARSWRELTLTLRGWPTLTVTLQCSLLLRRHSAEPKVRIHNRGGA